MAKKSKTKVETAQAALAPEVETQVPQAPEEQPKKKSGKKKAAATDPAPSPAPEDKAAPKQKPAKEKKPKKTSALDAAAWVLGEANQPMNCQEMIVAMAEKGYWSSPNGQTPHATLYSAILREINTKGEDSRFKKAERGKFVLNG
jgi:outer membrane biosynthesis protein TonB